MPFKCNRPAPNKWVERLKITMDIVRKKCGWETLLEDALNSSNPLHTYMYMTTVKLFENQCKITHLLCLFTFLIDVCARQISRNGYTDVDKVIENVLTFLTTQQEDNCLEFRAYLDMY